MISAKIVRIVPKAGVTVPQFRASLCAGPAAIYELLDTRSTTRTVMRHIDTSMRIHGTCRYDFQEPLRVVGTFERNEDIEIAVNGQMDREFDISIRSWQLIEACIDVALGVTRDVGVRCDMAQRIGRLLEEPFDLQLIVYIVLIDESHLIAT